MRIEESYRLLPSQEIGSTQNRRLATETYVPDPENPTAPETLAYTFDPDDLGVRVKADSTFTPEEQVSFTVSAGGDDRTIANTYDRSGRLIERSWANDQVVQTLTWDAAGKLVRVTQTDNRLNRKLKNFAWNAVYDPKGCRIETTSVPDRGAPKRQGLEP